LVYYASGKVDFMVGRVDIFVEGRYDRPFRVLLDKDKLARDGLPSLAPAPAGPRSMAVGQAVAAEQSGGAVGQWSCSSSGRIASCSRRQDQ
jgi:hypothetical protein